MARDIDWDKELSDEDRAWAEQRPDQPAGNGMTIAEKLRANDEKFGREQKVASMSRAERLAELRSQMDHAQNEIERLEREQAEEDNANVSVPGGGPNLGSGKVVDNTGVDGQSPQGAPEGAETYQNEKYWTKAKLTEEIQARNEDRVAQDLAPLATTGTRAELVERLIQDDKELEG